MTRTEKAVVNILKKEGYANIEIMEMPSRYYISAEINAYFKLDYVQVHYCAICFNHLIVKLYLNKEDVDTFILHYKNGSDR